MKKMMFMAVSPVVFSLSAQKPKLKAYSENLEPPLSSSDSVEYPVHQGTAGTGISHKEHKRHREFLGSDP
jgi:hypothetical protein